MGEVRKSEPVEKRPALRASRPSSSDCSKYMLASLTCRPSKYWATVNVFPISREGSVPEDQAPDTSNLSPLSPASFSRFASISTLSWPAYASPRRRPPATLAWRSVA